MKTVIEKSCAAQTEFNAIVALFDDATAGIFDTATPRMILAVMRRGSWYLNGLANSFVRVCHKLGVDCGE